MSPLRAFYNHDHPKPPHVDNPADSRIGDYRSRPVVTRELLDEPDNFQMSLALIFISLGRVVIETHSTSYTYYLPMGATTERAPFVFIIYFSLPFRHGTLTFKTHGRASRDYPVEGAPLPPCSWPKLTITSTPQIL